MSARRISYGKCFLCKRTFAKNAITRHLAKCLPAYPAAAGAPVRLFHILAQGQYAPQYWLHLEVRADATLTDLDGFLRAIWLECCDHLSQFTINGVLYERDTYISDGWNFNFGFSSPTASMDTELGKVLAPGDIFTHEYDFGTTTELKLQVVGERMGVLPTGEVRILARNYAPDYRCAQCDRWATLIDIEEGELLCDRHGRDKDTLPLVNSPRTGQCGYNGPYVPSLRFEEHAPAESSQAE